MTASTLGRYVVLRPLATSASVDVYQARDPQLDRLVAIKVLHPARGTTGDFEEKFRSEARLVAALRHPHIVQVHDFGLAGSVPFMVTEYLDGGTLGERLAAYAGRGERMPLSEAVRILDPVADALDAAHRLGIVHAGLSPANILFTARDQPVVTDFGMAAILGTASLADPGATAARGAPAYASPEQAAGREVDARGDCYALGAVLYEMVAGRPPFTYDTPQQLLLAHLTEPVPPPSRFDPDLSPAVDAVILRALAKDPAARFPGCLELARAFAAAARGKPVALPPAIGQAPPAWLKHMAGAAEMMAPLVGRQAPNVAESPRDRRGLLATILGIVGVTLAAFQFLAAALDLVSRSVSRLMLVLPYLIAASLVAGAGLMLYLALRAKTAHARERARTLFSLTMIAGLAWAGWTFYDAVRPPAGIVIAIADFDGKASREVDFARHIYEQIKPEIAGSPVPVVLERTFESYPDEATARAHGAARKATIVIWGWYDDAGVSPHVEMLRMPAFGHEVSGLGLLVPAASAAAPAAPGTDLTLRSVARYVRAPVNLPEFDVFVKNGPQQMAYVSTFLLGMIYYANGDSAQALAHYDKALANAPAVAVAAGAFANAAGGGGDEIVGREAAYFQRATILYAQNRLPEAVADLQSAIALKPDLVEAHHNLAILYSITCAPAGRLADALAEAQIAVRLRPGSADEHALLGDLYRQSGQYAQAVPELQRAATLAPDDARIQQLLSNAYADAGQDAPARQSAERAIALYASQAGAAPGVDPAAGHLNLGDACMLAGRTADALAEYEAGRQISPANPAVYRGIGNALYWQGKLDEAAAAYAQGLAVAPQDGSTRLLLGMVYLEQKDRARAMPELAQAAQAATCSTAEHVVLAGAYYEDGDYARAASEYEIAGRIDPKDADLFYLLGQMRLHLAEQGQASALPAAVQAFAAATELRPAFPEAHFALGEAYFQQGDYERAEAEWTEAAKQRPQDPGYLNASAHAYEKLKRPDDAAAAYRASLALKDDANVRVFLGAIYQDQGKPEAAIAEYQNALKLDPHNFLAHSSLGILYDQQGRLGEAADAYRAALAERDEAYLRQSFAGLLARQGRPDDAIAEYERVIAADPGNVAAFVALGNLFAQANRLDEATARYAAAAALDSNAVAAHSGLGQVEYKRCNLSQAAAEAKIAASLAPDNTLYTAILAAMYEALGRPQDAAQGYAILQSAPAADAIAHLLLGDYLVRASQPATDTADVAEGVRHLTLAVESSQNMPGIASLAHEALGHVYYRQKKTIAAEAEFHAALQGMPANAAAQTGLGDLALRDGDVSAALAAYDAAAKLLPAYALASADNARFLGPGLAVRRGLALERQGQPASAAYAEAVKGAQALVAATPRWSQAHFVLALAYLAAGDRPHAGAEFAAAVQCDASLAARQSQAEADLIELRGK